MSWGSFLTLEEAEAFAWRHMQGGEVNDVSRQGASLRLMFESVQGAPAVTVFDATGRRVG